MRYLSLLAILALISCKALNPLAPSPYEGPEPPFVKTKPCLQVGFNQFVDKEDLRLAEHLGFEVIRHDVQALEAADINNIIRMTTDVGLEPLLTVRDASQLSTLPSGFMYELRNEPDIFGPGPEVYRSLMLEAAEVARLRDQILYVGVVSNLNNRGFDYLKAIRPFPENVRVSVHRYGDGTFENPHRGFSSRHAEVKWLRETIGNLSFGVSEFGYPTEGLGESKQAYHTQQEFEFWHGKADFSCLYQINDGPLKNETYGIRRFPDKSLKPNAQVLRNIR